MKASIFRGAGRLPFLAACWVFFSALGLTAPLRAQSYIAIHNFLVTEANSPRAKLVQDNGGFLYGTAPFGGMNGVGSVFKLDQAGNNFLVLHDFNNTDGSNPYGQLTLAGDGFLYGSTQTGGIEDGVVFKIDTNGNNFSVLHNLDGVNEGGDPWGGVVVSGTTIYGTARDHGNNNFGTIFKLGTDGLNYVVTYVFGSGTTDGSHPYGGLLLASDGRLYGTTEQGHNGTGLGTVFGVDVDGNNFATLHTFTGGTDGQDPKSRLIEGSDGFLYGTTIFGGSGAGGTAFRLRKDGTSYSVIHSFANTDGTSPNASLNQIPGGLLYGTARNLGTGGGTLFHMTTTGGLFFADHDFASASGDNPEGAVQFGTDSALYGAASSGGANSVGAVYRFTIPTETSISPTSGVATGGTQVTVNGTGFQSGANVTFGGSLGSGTIFVNANQVKSNSPALTAGTLNDVVVSNPDSTIALLQNAWLADFLDVPQNDIEGFHNYIEKIFRAGITAGYGNGFYGIDDSITRAQMAVFILKGEHGSLYTPPSCTGIFTDVECSPTPAFAVNWIEQLFNENITGGCLPGPQYCPDAPVTRAQMAVFLLKAEHGPAYTPPLCAGIFQDVPCPPTPEFPFSNFIEQLFNESITGGCTDSVHYCPDNPATRGQMAVFLVRTFGL